MDVFNLYLVQDNDCPMYVIVRRASPRPDHSG